MRNNLNKIQIFLSQLGFDSKLGFQQIESQLKIGVDFIYKISDFSPIYFKYLPETTLSEELYELHKKIWNENKTDAFIIMSDNKTFLCASKYKPDAENPLKCIFEDFSYGINSPGFESEKLKPLLKENIDFGFFWNFIKEKIKGRRRQSVDYDLLLNLRALKRDLCSISELSSPKSYILIERCLFLKFLEDRGFHSPPTFIDILNSGSGKKLIERFNEVNKSLNGDIYDDKTIFTQEELSKEIMCNLHDFFTSDYRNKQSRLFPYKFDIIPVELLSNIYEAFLKAVEQAANGIYYTPSNLVDLVLSDTLMPMLENKPMPTCLDFACGSGIFLVKSFRKIIDRNNCWSDFEKKRELLKKCIFGVEKDPVAARITIFSLYLTLLEGEDPKIVKQLIGNNKIKFPKLLGKNILWNDALYDELDFINEDSKRIDKFDVVMGNPPWGVNLFTSVGKNTKMKLSMEKQKAIKPIDQSSQYFILKAEDFMKEDSIAGFVFNNTNLLMKQAEPFRKQILKDYKINTVYELTQCNSILFNKQKIEDLIVGADEPAVVMIFHKKKDKENDIKYVTPSIDELSIFLRIIVIKACEVKNVSQSLLLENDRLWRVLAIGDMEDYRLIEKLEKQKENVLIGLKGFEPTLRGKAKMILKDVEYADKDCIETFVLLKNKIQKTPSGGIKISRRRSGCNPETKEYEKRKLLIKRYVEKNSLKVKAGYDDIGYRFKDNLLGLVFDYDYRLMLSFYNSSLVSYFLYFNSAQIGKGTYNMLHKNEIESVPIILEENIPAKHKKALINLAEKILKKDYADPEINERIDEIIFDIYHLKEFEKQRIRDFFNIRYRDNENKKFVRKYDLQNYVNRFRDVFRFILKDEKYLNTKGYISSSIGTGIIFALSDIKEKQDDIEFLSVDNVNKLIQIASKKILDESYRTKLLRQEKVKIYDKTCLIILKSNQFKDWTETEAIRDANEEIGLFLKNLPKESMI